MEQVKDQVSLPAEPVGAQFIAPSTSPHLGDKHEERTERHQSRPYQHALQKLERLETVLAHAPVVIYAMDRTGIVTLLEGNRRAVLGLANDDAIAELLVSSVFDLYQDVPAIFDTVRRALTGEAFAVVNEINGRMFESRFQPLKNEQQDVTSIVCVVTDVTAHAQEEQRLLTESLQLASALQASEERFHTLVTNAPIILTIVNREGIVTFSEGKGLNPLIPVNGTSVGRSIFDHYRNVPKLLDDLRRAMAGEAFSAINLVSGRVFETQFLPIRDEGGDIQGVACTSIDITEREQAVESLRESEQRFRALTEQASDLVLIINANGIYSYASPSHRRITGYEPETLLDINIFSLIHPEDKTHVQAAFRLTYKSPDMIARTACRVRHADGHWITIECVGRNCLHDPAVQGFIVNARDITEQMAMEETLRHQALHDALTDLPNRTFLLKRLSHALMKAERKHHQVALLMMDLDRFKEINDTFGHQHGDYLLQQVSKRLVQAIGNTGLVSRLGGDEFAILLPIADEESTQTIATQLRYVLDDPFTVAGYPLHVEASVGIVLYPMHGTDALTLLRRADVAMYTAKSTHEGVALYKDAHDDQHRSHRLTLIGALRAAIATNGLKLYYQPKVSLKTGITSSVEALARWQHPVYGFVPPDQFITLAEQTGLINALTAWVLETAIQQCSTWLQSGLELSIAVNLSTWNLRDTALPDTILNLLTRYAVPPSLLRFEVTESAIMTDTDRALDVLTRISRLGISISVDDFGTGYSSLAYLKRLPIDELKIDRSFVQHMTEVEADATIVNSTVMLAHSLGLQVVAEGVEDQETLNRLADFHCDLAQGYYMSRPIPACELERWLGSMPQMIAR
jgi:diguanylate cyclase (GGDEF)-like protein/PAS domain S-box-containing protein